ncbi:MAG: hypothetical protein QNJ31_02880 [Candidatus Caenarcaniphilales bacterium]|nr:hypothetical protein [Candidatus Caenarcaniphilales bacterium]
MKTFVRLLFVIFISNYCSITAIAEENTLFRGFDWGTTKADIKQKETAHFIQENQDGLMYEDQMFHRRFNTAYFFHNDQLYRGVYSLQDAFKNEGGYLQNNISYFVLYNNIVDDMKEDYGEPSKEVPLPKIGTVNVDQFLEQVEQGKKVVLAQWNLGQINITTALKGSKGQIKVLKVYDYKPLLEEIKQNHKDNQPE